MTTEQITVHNLSKKKQPAKPATRSRGRMMDFAPRPQQRARAAKPRKTTIAVTEVETGSVAPSRVSRESVARVSAPEPIPVANPVPERPPVKKVTNIAVQDLDVPKAPLGAHVGLMSEAKSVPKPEPVRRPAEAIAPEAIAPVVPPDYYAEDEKPLTVEAIEEVEPVSYRRQAPDPREKESPFLESVSVEKRPLSERATVEPVEYPRYEKNIYDDESEPISEYHKTKKKAHHKTKIVQTKKKKSKASMIILIVATALLGIALGVLIYFAFFGSTK